MHLLNERDGKGANEVESVGLTPWPCRFSSIAFLEGEQAFTWELFSAMVVLPFTAAQHCVLF